MAYKDRRLHLWEYVWVALLVIAMEGGKPIAKFVKNMGRKFKGRK